MARFLAAGSLRTLNLLVLATLLALGAFTLGRAGAARQVSTRRHTATTDAVRHAAPAVASVFAEKRARRGYWKQSSGAGVIVHPAGYVITNSHVIRGGQRVRVELFHGGGKYEAEVVANAPGNDLALLRIRRAAPFPYVSVADSRRAVLGESVIAIGNPHGLGDTITVGVVSALGRNAQLSSGVSLQGLIQTDASINTGNSGGALLNLDGELLGVIVSLLPRSTGIAFAIPGEQVRALLQRALGASPASKPLPAALPAPGVAGSQVAAPRVAAPRVAGSPGRRSSSVQQRLPAARPRNALPPPRVDTKARRGAPAVSARHPRDYGLRLQETGSWLKVTAVRASSAASLAGIRAGDLILALDGRPVETQVDLIMAFSASRPGRVYQFELLRSGDERHASLVTPR